MWWCTTPCRKRISMPRLMPSGLFGDRPGGSGAVVLAQALYARELRLFAHCGGRDCGNLPAPGVVGQSAASLGPSGLFRNLGEREVVGVGGPGVYEAAGAGGQARVLQQGVRPLGCGHGCPSGPLWGAGRVVPD